MKYWDSFGYEWTHWSKTQLYGKENDETFTKKTGLRMEDVKGKSVLDVGCGMGRFLEVVSRWGARMVVGVDPSSAIESAWINLKDRPNTHYSRVGIEDYDYPHITSVDGFDIVYCIGVLHHTPDPKKSFMTIVKLVKPGGSLHVWVYGKMAVWDMVAQIHRKLWSTHIPWGLLRIVCYMAGPWDYVRRIPIIGKYLWVMFPCSTHPNWKWRILDTFDWYSPKYQSKHTVEEVKGWFVEAGFRDITECEIPISVKGVKQ